MTPFMHRSSGKKHTRTSTYLCKAMEARELHASLTRDDLKTNICIPRAYDFIAGQTLLHCHPGLNALTISLLQGVYAATVLVHLHSLMQSHLDKRQTLNLKEFFRPPVTVMNTCGFLAFICTGTYNKQGCKATQETRAQSTQKGYLMHGRVLSTS